jgi:hypothetical protein
VKVILSLFFIDYAWDNLFDLLTAMVMLQFLLIGALFIHYVRDPNIKRLLIFVWEMDQPDVVRSWKLTGRKLLFR